MRDIFNIGGYLKRNINLNIVWLLTTIAIYSYAPLINTVLIEYYNMTEDKLSFLSGFFIFGFLFAFYLNNFFMNNHYNIVKILMVSNIGLLLCLIAEVLVFSADAFSFNSFVVLRVLDGFFGFLVSTTVVHIISSKILRNEFRIKITSLMSTVGYIVKTLMPILVSLLIVTTSTPAILFGVGIVLTSLSALIIYSNRKFLYFKYTRVLLNNTGSKKRNTMNEVGKFYDRRVAGFYHRIYYLVVNGIHNIVRSAYDLVIPASLLINYNYNLAEVAVLISFMMVGQAMQFKIQFTLKIVDVEILYLAHLLISFVVIISIFWWWEINYVFMMFMFFLLGVSRSAYAIWTTDFGMKLISKDITLQNLQFINGLASEGSHLLGYGIVILLITNSGDYTLISLFYGLCFVVLAIVYLYFNKLKRLYN